MTSSFNSYYYDQHKPNNNQRHQKEFENNRKINVAKEAVCGLLDHLNEHDRFGMVLFNGDSHVARPLATMKKSDKEIVRESIKEIKSGGSTNMEAGYKQATKLFKQFESQSQQQHDQADANESEQEYDNRIIFLTDDMPNMGNIDKDSLLGLTKSNSEEKVKNTRDNCNKNIYSTFVGVGVDFNSQIVDYITKIRGANYYSVHSSDEFLKRMNDEFDFMVTPLVFDLKMTLESDHLSIDHVYGSNSSENNINTTKQTQVMHVPTLFPSAKSETTQETKGGIILAKLVEKQDTVSHEENKDSEDNFNAKLSVSYKDAQGNLNQSEQMIDFANIVNSDMCPNGGSSDEKVFYDNNGVRKGVLLTRYVDLLHEWIDTVKVSDDWKNFGDVVAAVENDGGGRYVIQDWQPSPWERQSTDLMVSREYRQKFIHFKQYFVEEMKIIGDSTLQQEVDILDKLINYQQKEKQLNILE